MSRLLGDDCSCACRCACIVRCGVRMKSYPEPLLATGIQTCPVFATAINSWRDIEHRSASKKRLLLSSKSTSRAQAQMLKADSMLASVSNIEFSRIGVLSFLSGREILPAGKQKVADGRCAEWSIARPQPDDVIDNRARRLGGDVLMLSSQVGGCRGLRASQRLVALRRARNGFTRARAENRHGVHS
jgi:hypothetical protein